MFRERQQFFNRRCLIDLNQTIRQLGLSASNDLIKTGSKAIIHVLIWSISFTKSMNDGALQSSC
jgi:hypothetical protein